VRVRIYVDGRPDWSANEPDCRARVAGYGGSALGHVLTPSSPAKRPEPKRLPRQPLYITRNYARCGALMPVVGLLCARMAGHLDSHRSGRHLLDRALSQRSTR
jgi:hypothetical protein